MYIYLDTNIWNALCDQNIDPKSLVTALSAKSSTIVFGSHNVFELAKTFMPGTDEANTRGALLFAYVAQFLDLGIPIIRETMETLQLEAHAFVAGGGFVNPFLSGSDYTSVRQEVGKLAARAVEGKVKEFLAARTQFAKDTRSDQIDHFVQHPDMKDALKAITAEQLPDWYAQGDFRLSGAENVAGPFTPARSDPSVTRCNSWPSLFRARKMLPRGDIRRPLFQLALCESRFQSQRPHRRHAPRPPSDLLRHLCHRRSRPKGIRRVPLNERDSHCYLRPSNPS